VQNSESQLFAKNHATGPERVFKWRLQHWHACNCRAINFLPRSCLRAHCLRAMVTARSYVWAIVARAVVVREIVRTLLNVHNQRYTHVMQTALCETSITNDSSHERSNQNEPTGIQTYSEKTKMLRKNNKAQLLCTIRFSAAKFRLFVRKSK